MADESNDVSPMQAQLGLLGQSSFNPLGIPTPPVQAPVVQHPGDVSKNVVQQTQTQAIQTIQSAAMLRPGMLTPGASGFGSMFPGYGSPVGDWAGAYRQNMAGINGQMFNPTYAQMMSGMSGSWGGPGLNASMMPNPTSMTDPMFGLYRAFPPSPGRMVPPMPQLPLFPTPFMPTLPPPRFQTPVDYSYNIQQTRADQFVGAGMAMPGIVGRGLTDLAGMKLGGGLGAAIGALVGGPMGARLGSTFGPLAGIALAESGPANFAQRMIDGINPARPMMIRGAQVQGMSSDFVVSGPELSQHGRGFSRSSALRAGRMIEDLGYDSAFKSETGFSVQDMTRISRTAGQNGLLDSAQTGDQMRDEVKKLARTLKTFMQVANEPDVQEAIRQMGQMRSMGFDLSETNNVAMNARLFARMAGTSIRGSTQAAGLPGAMMFQQNGLSAGTGLTMGQGMLGMARQAVAAGAFTNQQLAMLGGVQGIAQRDMEGALATLKLPMLLPAMATWQRGGGFGLNAGNVQGLLQGRHSVADMAGMGVNNLAGAVAQGGIGAIGMFLAQQPELQDQLGRAMGPVGMNLFRSRNIMNTQEMLGLGNSPGALMTAAMAMGLSPEEARQFVATSQSPMYHAGIQRHYNQQHREIGLAEQERFRRERGGWLQRAQDRNDILGRGSRGVARGASDAIYGFRRSVQRFGGFFAELGEDMFTKGGLNIRTPEDLLIQSDAEARRIRGLSPDALNRVWGQMQGAGGANPLGSVINIGGRDSLNSSWLASWRDRHGGDADRVKATQLAEGGSIFTHGTMLGRVLEGRSSAQLEQSYLNYVGGAELSARGMNLGVKDEQARRNKLGQLIGSNAAADAVLSKIGQSFAGEANKQGVRGGQLLQHGEKARKDFIRDRVHNEADDLHKKGLLTADQRDKVKGNWEEYAEVALSRAQSNMTSAGREWLRGPSGGIGDKLANMTIVAAADEVRKQQNADIFGKGTTKGYNTGESLSGTDEQRSAVLDQVAAMNPKMRGLFLAQQAQLQGEPGVDIEKYLTDRFPDEEERARARRAVLRLATDDSKNRDLHARMYRKFAGASGGNNVQMESLLDQFGETRLGTKKAVALTTGLQKILGASNYQGHQKMFDDAIRSGPGDFLDVLQNSERGGFDKKIQGYLNELDSNPNKRSDIAKAIYEYAYNTGVGATQGTRTTTDQVVSDQSAATMGQEAASVQAELAKNFPQAVDVFKQAADNMLLAANALLNRHGVTSLPLGYNEGGYLYFTGDTK